MMEPPADSPTSVSDSPEPENKTHVFDDPGNVKRLIGSFFAVCAVLIALDLVFHREGHLSFASDSFPVEGWFGFYATYGFVACVLLVLIAKVIRKLLMRGEDYYER